MQIISNLEKATNYDFKFTQQINKKRETGNCILVFDKKINCRYDKTAKILVSDGKNLVIKNKNSNISNFYKLENTSFYKLLDKKYLINELTKNEIKNEYEKLFIDLNYQNIKIKIFFDKEKLLLNGWETTDIYNNYVLTEIKIRKINKTFDENLFNLNKFN
tara:strand:+ start:2308 stop:2790 length:483 start_codon:yes stop_codon:yes gene_type:complete